MNRPHALRGDALNDAMRHDAYRQIGNGCVPTQSVGTIKLLFTLLHFSNVGRNSMTYYAAREFKHPAQCLSVIALYGLNIFARTSNLIYVLFVLENISFNLNYDGINSVN